MTTRLDVQNADDLTTVSAIKDALETCYHLLDGGLSQVSVLQALMEIDQCDLKVHRGTEVICDVTTATEVLNVARIQLLDAFVQLGEATTALGKVSHMKPKAVAA